MRRCNIQKVPKRTKNREWYILPALYYISSHVISLVRCTVAEKTIFLPWKMCQRSPQKKRQDSVYIYIYITYIYRWKKYIESVGTHYPRAKNTRSNVRVASSPFHTLTWRFFHPTHRHDHTARIRSVRPSHNLPREISTKLPWKAARWWGCYGDKKMQPVTE